MQKVVDDLEDLEDSTSNTSRNQSYFVCPILGCHTVGSLVGVECSKEYAGVWECDNCKVVIDEGVQFYSCNNCWTLGLCSGCAPQQKSTSTSMETVSLEET